MFTWVCPQCGREVPPSYTECPDCKKVSTAPPPPDQPPAAPPSSAAPPHPQPPPPPGPQFYPPQQQPPVQQQYAAPAQYGQGMPQYYQQPRRTQMPVWLLTIIFAVGI